MPQDHKKYLSIAHGIGPLETQLLYDIIYICMLFFVCSAFPILYICCIVCIGPKLSYLLFTYLLCINTANHLLTIRVRENNAMLTRTSLSRIFPSANQSVETRLQFVCINITTIFISCLSQKEAVVNKSWFTVFTLAGTTHLVR